MCGIIGCVGTGDAVDVLLTGLENLEYRGYDSAGIAVQNGSGINVRKRSGEVAELKERVEEQPPDGQVGIGHTRWSTHGPPTDENAHPHTDSTTDVAVVHNGIIENYLELKQSLATDGYEFTSDTDTEVVPHLIQHHLDEGDAPERAFRRAIDELEGTYAIAAMVSGTHELYAARQGSPLVVGVEDDGFFVASDVPAFLEFTEDVVYLEDGDVVVVDESGIEFTDLAGNSVRREAQTVDWDPDEVGKGGHDHFMLKEIHEQPRSLTQTLEGRVRPDGDGIELPDLDRERFEDVESVQLVACGTSYHAALYGAVALKRAGVPAEAMLANEYDVAAPSVDSSTLVIAVSQSGETADTLSALRAANDAGAETMTVTNVVGSTATRAADDTVLIRAGPEIGVAATKTFSSQAVVLVLLGHHIATTVAGSTPYDVRSLLSALDRLPDDLSALLETTDARTVARRFEDAASYFFIGRGLGYPVALEGALKFKEITYEHAEGFAAGELKHGPLALVTPKTPVFAVFTGQGDDRTMKNAEEAKTRGAPIVAVCPAGHDATEIADVHLEIPETHPMLAGLLANVQLQLLSYHAANFLDRPIDKPRNLAKSVTVE